MLVLHLDDDPQCIDFVMTVLRHHGYDVLSTARVREAQSILRNQRVDVIIIDYQLQGETTGLALLSIIRPLYPKMAMILLSQVVDREQIIDSFRLGIDDVLIKPVEPKTLVDTLGKALLVREAKMADNKAENIHVGRLRLDLNAHAAFWHDQRLELTPSELNILAMLSAQPGRVFSYAEMVHQITGTYADPNSASPSMKTHIVNLRRKLTQQGKYPSPLKNVHAVGYQWIEEDDAQPDAGFAS